MSNMGSVVCTTALLLLLATGAAGVSPATPPHGAAGLAVSPPHASAARPLGLPPTTAGPGAHSPAPVSARPHAIGAVHGLVDGVMALSLGYREGTPAVLGRYGHVHRELLGTQTVDVHDAGKSEGYYWTFVDIGTPPQRFSVIVDTGSGLTAVPCDGCATCGTHMDPKFDPSDSSTAAFVGCGSSTCSAIPRHECSVDHCSYTQRYAEGSMLKGDYITDVFQLGVHPSAAGAVPFTFGCHTTETKLFVSQKADGIMGMNQQDRTIVSVLQKAKALLNFTFSLCFTESGGQLMIGGYNVTQQTRPPVWLTLQQSSSMYNVQLNSMEVGGEKLNVPSSSYTHGTGCIVDSGTTFTYLPSQAHTLTISAINRACTGNANCTRKSIPGESFCFHWAGDTSSAYASFPTLQFRFKEASVDMPPRLYLNQLEDAWCVALYNNGNDGTVLGSNAMRGYEVIFDRGNGRVGFAPARCLDAPCDECVAGDHSDDGDGFTWILIAAGGGCGAICALLMLVACVRRLCRRRGQDWTPVQTEDDDDDDTAAAPPSYDEAVRQSRGSVAALPVRTVQALSIDHEEPV